MSTYGSGRSRRTTTRKKKEPMTAERLAEIRATLVELGYEKPIEAVIGLTKLSGPSLKHVSDAIEGLARAEGIKGSYKLVYSPGSSGYYSRSQQCLKAIGGRPFTDAEIRQDGERLITRANAAKAVEQKKIAKKRAELDRLAAELGVKVQA